MLEEPQGAAPPNVWIRLGMRQKAMASASANCDEFVTISRRCDRFGPVARHCDTQRERKPVHF
jgi:hypothetical protein